MMQEEYNINDNKLSIIPIGKIFIFLNKINQFLKI